jgi:hypothetical protein
MSTPLAGTVDGTDSSFDVRWARWREAGAAQDRSLNRRAALTGAFVACAVAVWLVISIALA